MTKTRRTILASLGLAPVGAIGIETFMLPVQDGNELQTTEDGYDKEHFALAFEKLAAEIRNGSVACINLSLLSSIEPNEILNRHTLSLKFLFKPDAG